MMWAPSWRRDWLSRERSDVLGWFGCKSLRDRVKRGLRPIPNPDLLKERREVVLDGALGQVKLIGDLAVVVAVGEQAEQGSLTLAQLPLVVGRRLGKQPVILAHLRRRERGIDR